MSFTKHLSYVFLPFEANSAATNRDMKGRAIAQAVSRWLPTAAARVWQVGFVVDKVALGQVFSEYFGFPCQSSFHHCSTITIIYRLGLVQ
jgi:hypothetical protein